MFGKYTYPVRLESGPVRIRIEEEGGFFSYYRSSPAGEVRKLIGRIPGTITISPVEPVYLPKEVTRYLEIRFTPVVLGPESEQNLFLKFPVEIGVFPPGEGDVLDIFAFSQAKYSLYGTPDDGIITRYYKSLVYDRLPESHPLQEGVLSLKLRNLNRGWVEVSRVVIDCSSLYLYYKGMVSLAGQMEIFSKEIADVRIEDRPLTEGMEPAGLLSRARKTIIPDKIPFTMEYGVGGR